MDSLLLHKSLILILLTLFFFSSTVSSDDKDKDKLLERLNSYRSSIRLPALTKNDNANCLADKIAKELDDEPCPTGGNTTSSQRQFSSYPKQLDKCHLNMSNVREGALLLSCTPGKVSSIQGFNFTEPKYTQFLNQGKYIGAGIDTEDNWVVVILSTNTPGGNFVASDSTSLIVKFGVAGYLLSLFLGFFLALMG